MKKNSYGMTPYEVAIQSGNAHDLKEIADHPEFDYKKQKTALFLQILEKSPDMYGGEGKVHELKEALYKIVALEIEKDPQNLGCYTPGFIRDDSKIVKNAKKRSVSN